MKFRKIKYLLPKIFVCVVLLFSNSGITVQAKSFIYPPTKHSVKEMYEKETDFNGGNPGKPGNAGEKGNPGKKGNVGKKGNPGVNGKGRFVIVW
ncbi:hypothetical protein [Enterococcus gilvus]|uniref:hypothetical protein n=1 Tax=Enterococcus gilvus TaxID=160453 RepID=UPI0028D6B548|nr:hypothetical protein [Enterococcus gilvus]